MTSSATNTINIGKGKRNAICILLLVFSFPTVAIINYTFEIQNGLVSIAFRLINLAISFLLILEYFINFLYLKDFRLKLDRSLFKLSVPVFLFLVFWLLYIIRMGIDLEFYRLYDVASMSKSYYYMFTFGITLIPMLAVFTMREINFDFLKSITHFYLIGINVCLLLIFMIDKFYFDHVGYRFWVSRNGFDYLDAISIAIYSGLLVIFSFINVLKGIYNYAFIFLGFFLMLSAASRGPVLFVVSTLLFILLFKDRNRTIKYLYLIIAILLAVGVNYVFSFIFKQSYLAGNPFFHRLNNFGSDESTVNRIKIIKDAFLQFLDSPFFGSHFLVIDSNMYAHNIVLDILLATGLLGLILVIPIFIRFANNLLRSSMPNFVIVIGFYFFLNTLTSGACYNMVEFWIFFVLIIADRASPKRINTSNVEGI